MDVLERVREIGAAAPAVSEKGVASARRALAEAISAENVRGRDAQRTTRRWIGFGTGSALVASLGAAAFVVATVVAPSPHGVPSAAAAEVFERAATVTVTAVDTTLAPGQYLKIEQASEWLQPWHAAWADDGDESTSPFNWGDRSTADAAVLVRDVRRIYVPADRSEDWFYDWGSQEVAESFGARGAEAAAAWLAYPAARMEEGEIERLPAGEFSASDVDVPPMPYLADSYRPFYDEMPREPRALLDWFRHRSGLDAREADDWVIASLEDPLSVNLMPVDLRAATFRALALMPGIVVGRRDGAVVTLERVATAHEDRTTVIVVDTAAGYLRSVSTDYGVGGVAGDTPSSTLAVTMSVVDRVPTR